MKFKLPKRSSNYWKLLGLSRQLYRTSLARVLPLSLLLSLIFFTPRLITDYLDINLLIPFEITKTSSLWLIIINLFELIVFISLLWRVHCLMINKHETFADDFKIGIKKFLPVFLANIVITLLVVFNMCIFTGLTLVSNMMIPIMSSFAFLTPFILVITQIFVTLYLFTLLIFLAPLIAIEHQGVFSALIRSLFLAWNHFWRVICLQITPWLCYLVVLAALKQLFNIPLHMYFFAETPHTLFATLINIGLFTLFIPWSTILILLQMNDLEILNKMVYRK